VHEKPPGGGGWFYHYPARLPRTFLSLHHDLRLSKTRTTPCLGSGGEGAPRCSDVLTSLSAYKVTLTALYGYFERLIRCS